MTLEQFFDYKEKAFDAFCKALIRNESIDAFREIARGAAREIALSAISWTDRTALYIEDEYRAYCKTFQVHGYEVQVQDWAVGEALQALPPKRRDVILLFYFLECSEPEIGKLLHLSTGAVSYRRITALNRLKSIMEDLRYAI